MTKRNSPNKDAQDILTKIKRISYSAGKQGTFDHVDRPKSKEEKQQDTTDAGIFLLLLLFLFVAAIGTPFLIHWLH